MDQEERGYSQPLLVDVRVRHRPTKARPSRMAPTSYTVPFPTLAPNPQHTPSNSQFDTQFNGSLLPHFMLIKKGAKNARGRRASVPTLL